MGLVVVGRIVLCVMGMVKPLSIRLGQVLGEAVRASYYTTHQMDWARVRLFHGIKVLHGMSNKEKLVWFRV